MRACSGRGGGTVRARSVRMRCTGEPLPLQLQGSYNACLVSRPGASLNQLGSNNVRGSFASHLD